jgi:hypothetical protein
LEEFKGKQVRGRKTIRNDHNYLGNNSLKLFRKELLRLEVE